MLNRARRYRPRWRTHRTSTNMVNPALMAKMEELDARDEAWMTQVQIDRRDNAAFEACAASWAFDAAGDGGREMARFRMEVAEQKYEDACLGKLPPPIPLFDDYPF